MTEPPIDTIIDDTSAPTLTVNSMVNGGPKSNAIISESTNKVKPW